MNNKTELLKKQIEALDVKADEFFDLYKIIWDKYWTLPDDASEYMKQAKGLSMFIERYDADKVILLGKIATELFKMDSEKSKYGRMVLGFEDKEYIISISTDKDSEKGFEEMLKKAHEAMKSGNIKVKNKSKFGKRFF